MQLRAARHEFEHQVAHARDQFDEANERIKERTGRNLIVAIVIALGLGAVLVLSLMYNGRRIGAARAAEWEVFRLLGAEGVDLSGALDTHMGGSGPANER